MNQMLMAIQSFTGFMMALIIAVTIKRIMNMFKDKDEVQHKIGRFDDDYDYRPDDKNNQAARDAREIQRKSGQLKVMGASMLLTPEELADEATYTSTFGENPYIQNNTRPITNQVCVLTPTFNSDNFLAFAKDIFAKVVANGPASLGSIVSDKLDKSQLPNRIVRFDVCFMHNYIVEDRCEKIKLLFNVHTDENSYSSTSAEKFFLTFSRENQMLNVTQGEVITINCPHCGGVLNFGKTVIQNCPFCGNTVTFAEYDWVLTEVERVTADTVVTNRAVIKRDTL